MKDPVSSHQKGPFYTKNLKSKKYKKFRNYQQIYKKLKIKMDFLFLIKNKN